MTSYMTNLGLALLWGYCPIAASSVTALAAGLFGFRSLRRLATCWSEPGLGAVFEYGKTPAQLRTLAAKAGVYSPDMKASELVAWLKKEFDLGQGHSMAIWRVFKDEGWVRSPPQKK
jgi:hypothetical protein